MKKYGAFLCMAASAVLLSGCGGGEKSSEAGKAAEAPAAEAAAPAEAARPEAAVLDFKNGTPDTVTAVYSSHSSKDNWDETNLLKQETLAPDATAEITVPIADADCMYDLRADREGKEPLVVKGIDMCKANGQVITITP